MWINCKLSVVLLVTTFFIVSIECYTTIKPYTYVLEENTNLCNFFDTINITGGLKNSDNSITFNNVRYAQENYATFNYTYLPNYIKLPTPPHVRGCICKYKTCVRMCCEPGHSFYDIIVDNKRKHTCAHNHHLNSVDVNVLHEAETKEINLLNNTFSIHLVSGKPCKTSYFLEPDEEPADEWRILSNGSIIAGNLSEPEYLLAVNHQNSCVAHVYNEITGGFSIKAMICTEDPKPVPISGSLIYPAFMVVSVIFLCLTLFVYCWIEELRRTIHGKNLMMYLVTLIVGYSFLALTYIERYDSVKDEIDTKCLVIAEIIHTSFICSFIWLSIISYDIWRTIGRTDNHRHQFFKYCLFAFGMTFIIVIITNIMDMVDWLPQPYRPGLGKNSCWLQDSKYSHFLYLYSIIIVVLAINSVLFTLTKMKIEWVKRISDRATNSEGSRKFSSREETDADRFGLFLRLFIIMGIPWIIEIVSWILDLENFVIYVLDIITMLQGPIIFFLFIKKRRVKQLIKRKLSTVSFRANTSIRNSGSGVNSSSAMTTVSTGYKLDEVKTAHE